ncbi:hypothetical protein ATK30_0343 [Amycolatopsis echigonensis]|uniref:Glycosyltransferase n=1 Tax=Amycolatopsis echigonensis TaxID=2576905 RepID=A0A2N3X2A5_9PSEU|nr:hypothetical protein [Amycolatopsis niigatensis]PKW00246.1 hypothetical protein ATK30_0343 [Amycolatopsis niigatensis]
MFGAQRLGKGLVPALAGAALAATLLAGCSSAGSSDASAASGMHMTSGAATTAPNPQKQIALYTAMRTLWTDHMQWTYGTVKAFFHNPDSLQPTLDRLLRDQKDLGAAIVPYYGQAAGDKLAALLTTHIQQAVPVLKAAQANDKAALDKAMADWYANAKEIADFLSGANPKNWPTSATEPMMKEHIDQTTTYSVDLLKGDYTKSIKDYDAASEHMMMLSDTLAKGIIAQFPDKFAA